MKIIKSKLNGLAFIMVALSLILSSIFVPAWRYEAAAETTMGDQNLIKNGEFADGLTGFKTIGGVEIVTSPKTGDTASIDGNAVYIPKGVDKNVLIAPVTLTPGDYVWSYETCISGNGGWASAGFGITTKDGTPWSNGGELSACPDIGTVKSYKCLNLDNSMPNNLNIEGGKFYYLAYGSSTNLTAKRRVTVNITVKQHATLYLWIAGQTAVQYINNMSLYAYEEVQTEMINGNFESGDLKGFSATKKTNNAISVVSEKQSPEDNVTLDGSVAYLKAVYGDALQTKIRLPKGKYKWTFDLYAIKNGGGWAPIFGIATGLNNGIAYGSNSAINATAADVGSSGVEAKTADKNGFYFEYGDGQWNQKIEVSFELSEEQTLYFFICSSRICRMYIDNMAVTEIDDTQTQLINGDFETGDLTGFAASVTNNATIKVVKEKQNDSDKVTLNGNAAYFTAAGGASLQTKIKLPAGKYKWKFDLYAVKTGSGWAPMFGIAKSVKDGLAYGTNSMITSEAADMRSGVAVKRFDNQAFYFEYGVGQWDHRIEITFELENEQVLYFFINSSAAMSMYVDNMELVDAATPPEPPFTPETWLVNGDFEIGDFTGYNKNVGSDMKIVDKPQNDSHNVKINGKALYLPASSNTNALQTGIKLPAGSYTWKFDAYVVKTGDGWNNPFGVVTEIGSSGLAMHSATIISQATAFNNKAGVTMRDVGTAGTNYHYFKYGKGQWDATATVKFTLYKEQTVYFFITSHSSGDAYIDNMSLVRDEGYSDYFDSGNLSENFIVAAKGAKAQLKNKRIEYPALEEANRNTGFIYKASELTKGKYIWSFEIGGTATEAVANEILAEIGVYGKLNTDYNICSENLQKSSVSAEGAAVSENTEYYAVNIEKLNSGENATVKVTVTFNVDKNSPDPLYLSTYIPGTKFKDVWLDNWALKKVSSFENGDFELGDLTGYLNNGAAWSKVKTVTKAQADAAGANVSGNYAAYIPAGDGKNDSASFITQAVKLNKGQYTVSFDVDIVSGNDISKFWFDVYGQLADNGLYAFGSKSAVSAYTKAFNMNGIEKATGFISNRQDRWLLSSKSNGVAHYKVYIMCDVTFDRTVYFTAGFDKNSSASSAYIDNINIVEGYLYNKPQKATYGDPYIVYQIDFESEFEQPITADNWRYDVLHYERSSAEAHSGKYSVRYDPAHKDGWQYLHFTDSNGYPITSVNLEPGAAYELSFWYKSTGAYALNAATGYQPAGGDILEMSINKANTWQKLSYTFIAPENADVTNQLVKVVSTFGGTRYKGTYIYYDDIRLEKLRPSVLADDIDNGKYCEDFFNVLENGNFEQPINGTIWENSGFNINRIENSDEAQSGKFYAHFSGNGKITVKLKVWKAYRYYFAYSYRGTKANNLKIGILDNNGKELIASPYADTKQTGLLSPSKPDGEWHRDGITFLSSTDGWIYFSISGTGIDIDLDQINIFRARAAYDEDPNDYGIVTVSDDSNNEVIVIPDEIEIPDFDDSTIEPDNTNNSNTDGIKKNSNKVSEETDENGFPWLVIIIVAAGIVAAAAIVTIIIITKKKKGVK